MKITLNLILGLFLFTPNLLIGQKEGLISRLEYVLFEKNIDSTRYKYSYWSIKNQDSIHIDSRYKNIPSQWKSGYVSALCDTIRWSGAIYLIPELIEILNKQEKLFINEWESVFDFIGGPEGLWEDQYNSLCIIDLTISYLTILKEKWPPTKKYQYIKNLYMLSYGDYDTARVHNTIYKSDYIRQKRTGYCLCLMREPNYDTNLIDEFFYNDPKMMDALIKDIEDSGKKNISDDLKKFFKSGLRNVFYKFKEKRIDSLLVNNPALFIKIGYNDNIDHWSYIDFPIKFYHLILGRYRFVDKNPELIDLLLDDIFKNVNTIENSRDVLGLVQSENDPLINYMINERFLLLISKSNDDKEIVRLINICNSELNKNQRGYLVYKAKKLFNLNLLSKRLKEILSQKLKI